MPPTEAERQPRRLGVEGDDVAPGLGGEEGVHIKMGQFQDDYANKLRPPSQGQINRTRINRRINSEHKDC